MAIAKVILNGETLMDVTSDTVTASNTLSGVKATKNDGTKVTGNIASKSSTDLTVSGATVTAPAGYYANAASKAVATATHPNPTATIASSTGVVTASHTQGTGYVTGGTTTGTLSLTTQAGKTITPTESAQTAVASYRWTTGPVSVAAISSTYVGTNVARKSAADLTTSGSVVTTPVGYYSSAVSKSVAAGSAFPPAVTITKAPTFSMNSATGVITASYTGSSSITPTVSSGWVSQGTAGTISTTGTSTFNLATQGAQTITPGSTAQTIASNRWLTGTQTIAGDSNLVAENIAEGVSIFGVEGAHSGVGNLTELTITPTSDTQVILASDCVAKTLMFCGEYSDVSGYTAGATIQINYMRLNGQSYKIGPEQLYGTWHVEVNLEKWRSGSSQYKIGTIHQEFDDIVIDETTLNESTSLVFPVTDTSVESFSLTPVISSIYGIEQVDAKFTCLPTGGESFSFGKNAYIRLYKTSQADGLSQVTVNGDSDLVAENIAAGVSIFGVEGTLSNDGFTTDQIAMRAISGDISGDATSIKSYAFHGCSNLTTVNFPACTSIGSYAFTYCNSLTTVSFPSCTTISAYAFAYCNGLTTANFPVCTTIYSNAFSYCDGLTTASFPACTSIGSQAFNQCSNLATVNFPACTSIGSYAFTYCYSLTTVNFPSCTTIGASAFTYCRSLTTISFPVCTIISTNAFSTCRNLTTVSFPACTSIGASAFAYCSSLTTVSFPACTIIGSSAFDHCGGLTTVSFPVCTKISSFAFMHCHNLLSVYLLGSSVPSLVASAVFSSTPIGGYTDSTGGIYGSIFVPASLYNSYLTATNWSLFSDRIVSV